MGSMLKFDSERRELVRERRHARIERKQQRRNARERKRSQFAEAPPAVSAAQRSAEERVDAAVDRIVTEALERHDQITAAANNTTLFRRREAMQTAEAAAPMARASVAGRIARRPVDRAPGDRPRVTSAARSAGGDERHSRRERDIAAFRERRRQAAEEAREEAHKRIARAGELACVTDALAALAHPEASPWESEREQLERALETGRIVEVGAVARRALWAVSRDAARSSRRARRDPDLALAACIAYAIIARLPRTALRSTQRTPPYAAAPARVLALTPPADRSRGRPAAKTDRSATPHTEHAQPVKETFRCTTPSPQPTRRSRLTIDDRSR